MNRRFTLQNHYKYPAHSCVVGCKERGGALPTVTALTAQGMTIMHLFVVQVIVSTTHGDTQHSVNKHTNNILNLTPSGDRNHQLILASHRRCFLEENKFRFSLCILLIIISALQYIVPLTGLPNQGFLKNHSAKLAF